MSTSPTVNPLGYQGVHSPNPPAIWFRPRDPDMITFKDFRNYEIGDEWQNTATRQFFKLASVSTVTGAPQGIWYPITYYIPGVLVSLTSDAGIATPALGTINLAGGTGINTSAAGAILTINLDSPVTVANGGTGVNTLTGVVIGNGGAAFTGNPVTQYDVLVGGAANAISSIAPATLGQVLISNGATANPSFSSTIQQGTISPFTITSNNGAVVATLNVSNTSGANGALISSVAKSTNVGFFSSGVYDTLNFWNFGMTTAGSPYAGAFNISYLNGQSYPEAGLVGISITQTGDITLQSADTNTLSLWNVTQGTIGAAGGASALPATPLGYLLVNVNGASVAIPYYTPA